MASIIDNRNKTMLESLRNSLKQSEKVDILTAFFYFSGFSELAENEEKVQSIATALHQIITSQTIFSF